LCSSKPNKNYQAKKATPTDFSEFEKNAFKLQCGGVAGPLNVNPFS
jgi:hypothetical protein